VLSACHEGGNILIRITTTAAASARQGAAAGARAWPGAARRGAQRRRDPQADLRAGFSTAEQVTNLSGRGVGMDVVRRNIEALRGSIELTSEPGQGCCIEIRLPLTLAIIDGFLVGVGSSKFIFPLDTVVEVIDSRPTTTSLDVRGCCVIECAARCCRW
jgi:two-component system chemotaxis sensor kinase CheA